MSIDAREGSWKEIVKGKLNTTIFLNDSEDLVEAAAPCYTNPLTAVALFEAIKSKKAKAIISTAAGSSLAKMVYRLCEK